jgi:PAS domain S-box-containing protein
MNLYSCIFGVAAFSGMTRTRIVWWSFVLLFLFAAESYAAEPRRVLMLHAFNSTFPATTRIADGARKRLLERSPQPLEIDADFLDLARNTDAEYESRLAMFSGAKYEKRPPDVVIALGSAALPFIVRHRDDIAPKVPVVISSVSPQNDNALQLPADEPTIWIEFRGAVIAAFVIVAAQSLILGALLVQRRRRLRAENLLRESEERMTFAAAAANIGLWQFDRHRNELWATEHCRAMFGIARDAPLTRDAFLSVVHPDDLQAATQLLQKSFETEQPAISDVRIVLPGEEVRWVRMRARSRSEGGGRPGQLGGIFIDITEQKSAEAEVALQRLEVEHLMRVSVLGELSGSIAHEVNQPLTAILSNAQAALHLLAQDSPDLVEIRDALEEIVHEDNRAGEVIHRLRGLLKKGERKAENVNINDLVRSTVSLLHSELIGRDIDVSLNLENSEFLTWGDSVQLQQVLLNLVMNAMDAMVSTPIAQRFILISTQGAQTGRVDVHVKDRGHGIRPKENGHVFEPFYTTKDHGLGLGLTLCSTIIQAHQGRLTLANDEGGGAIAVLSLPIQQPAIGNA